MTKLKEKDESLITPKVLLLSFLDNSFLYNCSYCYFDLPEDYEFPNWLENLVTSWAEGNISDGEFMDELSDIINEQKLPVSVHEV